METQMQLEVILAGNRQPPASCKAETKKESIKTKTKSGNCFCIEKENVGGRPAKLKEKRGNRDPEREIKNKGDIFCWKSNMRVL